MIYGGNLVGARCGTVKVSIANVNEILAAKPKNANSNSELYEDIDIYDSGPIYQSNLRTNDYSSLDRFLAEFNDEEIVTNTTAPSTIGMNVPIASSARSATTAYVNAGAPGEIYFVKPDGSKYVHLGGSLTWRANNPGALRSSNLTKRMGEIGVTANGFAIFANEAAGRAAQIALLKTPRYQNKTIAQAINTYAPASDGNNPQSYAAKVARALGVSVNTFMRDLADNQLLQVAMVIRKIESWRPGTEKDI